MNSTKFLKRHIIFLHPQDSQLNDLLQGVVMVTMLSKEKEKELKEKHDEIDALNEKVEEKQEKITELDTLVKEKEKELVSMEEKVRVVEAKLREVEEESRAKEADMYKVYDLVNRLLG